MSDSVQPQRWQPIRLPCPWDSPGKNTGVGCHFLLQCMKVKRESEIAQLCPTLCNPMDCSLLAPPSMGFSRQENWSGVPLPSPIYIYIYIYIFFFFFNSAEGDFPGGPVVKTLPLQGTQFQSLVGELRAHMPSSQKQKMIKIKFNRGRMWWSSTQLTNISNCVPFQGPGGSLSSSLRSQA